MKKKIVHVNNKMQRGYKYELAEPMGKNFAFDFKPDLTPKEMLKLGIFGGNYITDCKEEYPDDWFKNAKLFTGDFWGHDKNLNYFKIDASQPLSVWKAKGWINEEHDPRGWFEWYCRYYMGRRLEKEDRRQIDRWKQMVRHIGQIKKNCRQEDINCRPRQRQALLHWAYDSRKI